MSSKNFKLCPRCEDVTIHFSVPACSWCEAPLPPVTRAMGELFPCPCFQCGKPLGRGDESGEHTDKMVCVRNIRGDYIKALREIQRLKHAAEQQNVCKAAP